MELVWSDENPQKATNRFRVALTRLRKFLEPELIKGMPSEYILVAGDSYLLDLGERGWPDIDVFKTELNNIENKNISPEEILNCYLNAEKLYKGEFIDEDRYVDWCLEERERYKNKYLYLLKQIIFFYEENKAYDKCIEYSKKYIETDKFDEDAYCSLMKYYSRIGSKNNIKQTFKEGQKHIAEELGCPLRDESIGLYNEVMSG